MIKKYRFGFDIWGLGLFLLIMLPNFLWFAIPAPNDILRADSITPVFDTIGGIFQVIMIGVLCLIKNISARKFKFTSTLIIITLICCLFYFTAWFLYYQGIVNIFIILSLCIFPCAAFLFYEIDRKNYIAIIPTSIFSVCHIIYGFVNFIVC